MIFVFFFGIQSYDMLCSSLAWRRHHNVDQILTEWRPPEAVLEYYSGGWHHYDKGIMVRFYTTQSYSFVLVVDSGVNPSPLT